MQRLEVSGAVWPIYGSLGVKRLMLFRGKIAAYGANYTNTQQKCEIFEVGGVCVVSIVI